MLLPVHASLLQATTVAADDDQLDELAARLHCLEEYVKSHAPVDGTTAGALEARVAILEDDYLERQKKQQVSVAVSF